ncbi:50S ribosomal protein L19e [Candidatus Woesearchaeota archaeon]|nr:50S ribosomal protein L19e [Candidatus Woesearchaeota archaeon]|tara:strand:+ start:964 stop:1392 length:429 start_codon:yes stop_codon:yes gene_type:complete
MIQKRLAADILKCSTKRIRVKATSEEVKNAIRKADVRNLISQGKIVAKPVVGSSRVRARKAALQRKKGRQRGHGTRRGTAKARIGKKLSWMNSVRLQRTALQELRIAKKLTSQVYRSLYLKIRGGFFRSKRHLITYIEEMQK